MIVGKMSGENAESTFFVEQEIDTNNKNNAKDQGDINITRSHPSNGENEDLTTKGEF